MTGKADFTTEEWEKVLAAPPRLLVVDDAQFLDEGSAALVHHTT